MWGGSSAGRASRSHREGQGFDPPPLHHIRSKSRRAIVGFLVRAHPGQDLAAGTATDARPGRRGAADGSDGRVAIRASLRAVPGTGASRPALPGLHFRACASRPEVQAVLPTRTFWRAVPDRLALPVRRCPRARASPIGRAGLRQRPRPHSSARGPGWPRSPAMRSLTSCCSKSIWACCRARISISCSLRIPSIFSCSDMISSSALRLIS